MGLYITSVDGSSDKVSKYQENLDYQGQEVVSAPLRNPRRLRQGYQRVLRQFKSKIEDLKDKISSINKISVGSTQDKDYLIQVYMYQYELVDMRDHGVY